MTIRKHVVILVAVTGCLSACATGSVRMLEGAVSYKSGDCEVLVYPSKDQAIENGMTKEVCMVEGSSAFSWDHSIDGAIKNNIGKVCSCGVTKAYLVSAHTDSEMGIRGVSYVNLVGFR